MNPADPANPMVIRRPRLPRVAGGIQISDRVREVLAGASPLTVLRAARGFGKTSVLVTWLNATSDPTPVVYCTLDQRSNTEEGFWNYLADAGVPMVGPLAQPRENVLNTVAGLPAPLRLVLDDFHEAGVTASSGAIDDDLVQVVRGSDRLFLITAGRGQRELENLGSMSVNTAVLSPDDLKLTHAQLISLAASLGVSVEANCARQIVDDLGGWPAAIRAGLTNAAPESVVDESRVAGYLRTVLRDMSDDAVSSFFLCTAVPERFDAALAAAIVPDDRAPEALRRIRFAGLLREEHDVQESETRSGPTFSYPPAIRRALVRILHETEPEVEERVHQDLMHAVAARDGPAEVLHHAKAAGLWDTVAQIVERHWFELLTTAPAVVVQAAERAPATLVEQDPRLRVIGKHQHVISSYSYSPSSSRPWRVTEHPTIAAEITTRAESIEQNLDAEAMALALWGTACLMSDNHAAATYLFNQARTRGFAAGSMVTVLTGTVGLALESALNGEPDLAAQWLDEPELTSLLESVDGGHKDDVVAAAALLARALMMVDRCDPDAHLAVAGVVDPRARGDLWAMVVFARALHATTGQDSEEVLRQANQVRAALRHIPPDTLSHAVLTSTLVELLLFARMPGVAGEAAEQLGDEPIGWTARAKVRLAKRDLAGAVTLASKSVASRRVSRRSLLESHIILAAARHDQNEPGMARGAFADAVALAGATGQRRPFLLMRRYVFDVLAEGDPAVLRLWPGGALVNSGPPESGTEATLTIREAQVLRALEQHTGPVGIARSLGLSANTVKTHLQSGYRKLDVSSRHEALDAIHRAGLGAIEES